MRSRNMEHNKAIGELKELLGDKILVPDKEFSYEGLLAELVESGIQFVIRLNDGIKPTIRNEDGDKVSLTVGIGEQEYGNSIKQTPWIDRKGARVGEWVFSHFGGIVDEGAKVYRLEVDYTEGFQVSLNGEATSKQTPTSFVLSAGQYTVSLTKQGYKSYETVVDLGPQNAVVTVGKDSKHTHPR